MRRRLLPTLLALSLLLGVANVALWPVSHWWVHEAHVYYGSWYEPETLRMRGASLQLVAGHWILGWHALDLGVPEQEASRIGRGFRARYIISPLIPLAKVTSVGPAHILRIYPGVYGFRYRAHTQPTSRSGDMMCPAWLPALLFLAPPLIYLSPRLRRRRRRRRGLCPACGYDLRGSPLQGPGAGGRGAGGPGAICPECGAAPSPRPA